MERLILLGIFFTERSFEHLLPSRFQRLRLSINEELTLHVNFWQHCKTYSKQDMGIKLLKNIEDYYVFDVVY